MAIIDQQYWRKTNVWIDMGSVTRAVSGETGIGFSASYRSVFWVNGVRFPMAIGDDAV